MLWAKCFWYIKTIQAYQSSYWECTHMMGLDSFKLAVMVIHGNITPKADEKQFEVFFKLA